MIEALDKLIGHLVDLAESQGERDLAHRMRRARASLLAPIDPSADDVARRDELEDILRGKS